MDIPIFKKDNNLSIKIKDTYSIICGILQKHGYLYYTTIKVINFKKSFLISRICEMTTFYKFYAQNSHESKEIKHVLKKWKLWIFTWKLNN